MQGCFVNSMAVTISCSDLLGVTLSGQPAAGHHNRDVLVAPLNSKAAMSRWVHPHELQRA